MKLQDTLCVLGLAVSLSRDAAAGGAPADGAPTLSNRYLSVRINPRGARLERFTAGDAVFTPDIEQAELDGQMLWDSLDERMGGDLATAPYDLAVSQGAVAATLQTSDGQWRVRKVFELAEGESALRVSWQVRNTGAVPREISPWIASRVMPGRNIDRHSTFSYVRLDVDRGRRIVLKHQSIGLKAGGYALPARPWFAISDPLEKVSLVFEMEWAKLNWLYTRRPRAVNAGMSRMPLEFCWGCVPVELEPGQTWQTSYRLHVLRGLERVDWFSGSCALAIEPNVQQPGKGDALTLFLAASRDLGSTRISGHSSRTDGIRLGFPEQIVQLAPGKPARAYVQLGLKTPPAEYRELSKKGINYSIRLGLPGEDVLEADLAINSDREATITTGPLPRDVASSGVPAPFTSYLKNIGHRAVYHPRKPWAPREVDVIARTSAAFVWAQPSSRKVWRSELVVPGKQVAGATLSAPRGGRVSTSIVVRPAGDVLKQVTLAFGEFTGPNGTTIPRDAILVRRIGFLKNRSPSDLVRGRFEDVGDILFDEDAMELMPNAQNPFYVTVKVPYGIPAGEYVANGTLTDAAGTELTDLALRLQVHDVDLPERTSLFSFFGIWRQVDELLPRLLEKRLENGARTPRVTPFYFDGEKWVQQFDKCAAYMTGLFEQGLQRYRVRTLWHYDSEVVWADDYPADKRRAMYDHVKNPATRDSWLGQWVDYLRQRGLAERLYSYPIDEPPEDSIGAVRRKCDLAHKYGLETLVPVGEYHPDLEGYVDIWCPINYVAISPRLDEVRKRGDKVIWYICAGQTLQYPNLNTDLSALDPRIWLWQTYYYDLTGILYWSTTKWNNPGPERALSFADNYAPGRNGDGLLFYPNLEGGPIRDSARLEMISEGVQEYDLLRLCEEKLGRDTVMERLGLGRIMGPRPWDYTQSPEELLEIREKLLQLAAQK